MAERVGEASVPTGAGEVAGPADGGPLRGRSRLHAPVLSARRRLAGWVLAAAGVPLLTLALLPARDDLELSGDLTVFLMLVVAASAVGGRWPGLLAALGGSFALNWFFTEPVHTLAISRTENALALAGFLVVGGVISFLVTEAAQRTLAATNAAVEAAVAAESDALRAALLRAVSHDLRTPLASIKASVSSLRQDDVEWSPEATAEFLETIEDETDRLDALVGNLLDMSRLDAGAVVVTPVAVGWDEVVAGALASLSEPTGRVEVQVPESLPRVLGDPVLLERIVANLVGNALRHAPPPASIRVEAGAVGGRVDLRVVDTGPGVPPERHVDLFRPFQRLGDRSPGGVGLGLAVAHGFVDAMGGTLEAEESPGGGLTMVVRMVAA